MKAAWRPALAPVARALLLIFACTCGGLQAAPPGLVLPPMPDENPGPTPAEIKAQKKAQQAEKAAQEAERRAAEQRAAAQRQTEQAKADKAAAEARVQSERKAREAAEAEKNKALAEAQELKRQLAQAKAAAQQAAAKPAQATPLAPLQAAVSSTAASAGIADFTKLPSVPGGPVFVALPLGEFQMGSTDGDPDEKPVHKVKVAQRIAMSEKEITTAQYMACVDAGGCQAPEWAEAGSPYNLQTGSNNKYYQKFVADDLPVVGVNWENARQYAAWLSRQTGHPYRQPTEAEWELACRAGGSHRYCGSDDVDAVAWHKGNSAGQTHPGGQKAANAWGLYDMSGNVWEWVADCYDKDEYTWRSKSQGGYWPAHQTSAEKQGCSRVLRGGSWFNDSDNVRSANRNDDAPDLRYNRIGFRLVRILP